MTYTTLAAPTEHAEQIKGSDFLAYAMPLEQPEQALEWVRQLREQHPQANHVCWAYRFGASSRFSDDGEPGGTAGAPIYRALEGSGLDRVAVAVVRYFGGIKLGTGGLARAYGGLTAELLRTAPRREVRPRVALELRVPFEFTAALYHLLEGYSLEGRAEDYDPVGPIVRAAVLEEDRERLERELRDATRGRGTLRGG